MKYVKNYTEYIKENYKTKITEYFDSIKSFKDLDEEDVLKFIDYCGYEGFYSEEEAIEYMIDKIEEYKKLPDPCVLYRVVAVDEEGKINKNELGEHYTPYDWAIDGEMLLQIGSEDWDDDTEPYIMEVSVPLSEIDIKQTIIQNLSFPNEHEINLKNKGKGAKLLKIYKMY
jgi:hypothetical protein